MDQNEPILSGTDIDNIKATKPIMGHHIEAFEEFNVHNNIVYLELKKTVPEPDFLQYGSINMDRTLKMQLFVISSGDKISKLL